MIGEISFDTIHDEEENDSIFEGAFRLPNEGWRVFFFQKYTDNPGIFRDHVFSSGIEGIKVNYPDDEILNKKIVKGILSDVLGVDEWREVKGPDSLLLK